ESKRMAVFAQMVRLDGSLSYRSMLLVPKNGRVRSLEDLLAHPGAYSYAGGEPGSMAGSLVPSYYLFHKRGLDARKHFRSVSYGNHFDGFLAVAEGRADVASTSTEELGRYLGEWPVTFGTLRVLWESPPNPTDPMLYRTDLAPDLKRGVRDFFVNYGRSPAERERLVELNDLSGFQASTNYQLRAAIDLELFEALAGAMRDRNTPRERFGELMEQLTRRAANLDSIINASRFDLH
ncbi:MAG: PhnD/SsuA/transferrin family substrate-binding protein, partial [Solirubrobacteraceae bacterium]|nr:PhnD/SsuA/transferrin family substrate-binding protein [Solirubrobacteraceae bacterium]